MPDRAIRKLRVGVLGSHPDSNAWAEVLARRSLEIVEAESLTALIEQQPSLILAFAAVGDAEKVARELASRPECPPVTMILGSGSDHPHTQLVRALVQGKAEWESTFDAIVDPVALLNSDGTVFRANLTLARAVGRQIPETIGVHYRDLIGRVVKSTIDPIEATLEDGISRTEDTCFERLPGVFQVTTSPMPDTDGGSRGLVVILKDVSELREQQERLLQASRLADIGQLAAGVAHEINTPLASIALRAESLLKSAEDPRLTAIDSFKNFPRYLKTMDAEIFRCKKIISALLEFSRSRKPEVRETDLNALAGRAADLVGHQMRLKQVELTLELQPGLPYIQADDGQLRQALIALLMNALDATQAGGQITLSTHHEGDPTVRLMVADDGIGIPPEYLDKIFSPFFTTKPVGQGTGLGLAICHGIVAAHGGEIRVESEVNKGTRISLVLPLRGAREDGPPTRLQRV
jgi:signal transduction histidine kinase